MDLDFEKVPMENDSTKAKDWKSKGTHQLQHCTMVQNICSSRRLDYSIQDKVETSSSMSTTTTTSNNFINNGVPTIPNRTGDYEGSDDEDERYSPFRKVIYMVSNGTGWTT